MPIERNAPPLAEYFKFKEKRQRVIGKVQKFFSNENGVSMAMSPVIIWNGGKERPQTYRNIAIGLSTDLKYKIQHTGEDVGKWLSIELEGFEPTKKGAPRKQFHVLELEEHEVGEIARASDVDTSHRSDPFRNLVDGTGPVVTEEEGDSDLPF